MELRFFILLHEEGMYFINKIRPGLIHNNTQSEGFSPPNAEQRSKGASSIAAFHGFDGPVQVTFPSEMFGGPQPPAFVSAVSNLTGLSQCADLNGGDGACVAYTPLTLNWREGDNRSSSAEAYLTPVEEERTNWLTLVGHQATKILLEGRSSDVIASGVQFVNASSNGTGPTYTAYARKEVIVSAGAIGTPQLLQLSGIGDPSVLDPLGIETIVNLPTVGRNLQEQSQSVILHAAQPSFAPTGRGPPNCIAYPTLRELFVEGAGGNGSVTADQIAEHILGSYPNWAKEQAVNGLSAETLEEIFKIQTRLIVNDSGKVIPISIGVNWQCS